MRLMDDVCVYQRTKVVLQVTGWRQSESRVCPAVAPSTCRYTGMSAGQIGQEDDVVRHADPPSFPLPPPPLPPRGRASFAHLPMVTPLLPLLPRRFAPTMFPLR